MIDEPTASGIPRRRRDETALARFTRDLTEDARAGRLEPVRSRAEEVARVALFLAVEAPAALTGSCIDVFG